MTPASWVIVNRATGRPVQEVFGTMPPPTPEACEVVPIMEWLQRVAANPERYET